MFFSGATLAVMARVILVGDTHMPRFGRQLPGPLVDELRDADVIFHVGDITDRFVLDLLRTFAPVEAVAGNNDSVELVAELGLARVVEVDGLCFGLTHGHFERGRTTPERARRAFAEVDHPLDAICFGHSHIPLIERVDGLWLLNPGSPTDRRRQSNFSFMRVDTVGGEIRPRLVTYQQWREPAVRTRKA